MRVALLTPYWRPVQGGVTTYVAGLAAELGRTPGTQVLVLAREGAGPGAHEVGGAPREFARRALPELERFKPEVLHAHGHWYCLDAALRFRTRHRRARVVFTAHTAFGPLPLVKRLALRRLLSRADHVTAVSLDLLRQTLEDVRFRARTRVTPPGVSSMVASAAAAAAFRRERGLEGRRLVAWLGPLVHREKVRGLEHLVRAVRLVRGKLPEVILVVAGDGELRAQVEALARRELGDAAVFLGRVNAPATVLTATDVVAHVSFQEGLPLALLEAMACGRPILATAVGGIPEVLADGRNGVLSTGEVGDVAARLEALLAGPDAARRLGAQAARDAAIRWNWVAATRRFLPLYGAAAPRRVVVTVDLEKDYHTEGESWRGVDEGLPRMLEVFARHGVRAHVFATADLTRHHAEALRRLVREGHLLGCHAESHDVAYLSSKPPAWQARTLARATEALEACTGRRPDGFRAPNFSANGATLRALARLRYRYDSSVLPGRVVRLKRAIPILDHLVAPRDPYVPSEMDPALPGRSRLVEFPVTENPLAPGGPIGLGFLHAYGVEKALEAVSRSAGDPCVFLIHPWELVEPPRGRAPPWMKAGCRPDPAPLDAFLSRVGAEHTFTTFDEELAGLSPPRP
jgi:glycosyltransferase involved in cell wall biosynthesis